MTTPANKQLEQSQVGNSTRNFYFYGSAIILIVEEEPEKTLLLYLSCWHILSSRGCAFGNFHHLILPGAGTRTY